MNLQALHIANPEWIHGLWVWLVFVAGLVLLERRGRGRLGRLVAPALEGRLVEGPAAWRRAARLVLLALAGLAMIVALMRPQWGERFVAAPRVGAEIMIALDVSRSMLADDARPSRLERAKAEISDLLAYLEDDQVGLIAFAGRASVLSPLTPDKSFLRLALESAGPQSVSRGGTRLAEPILRAVAGLGRPGPAQRALILITDGEDHDSFALDAAKKAAAAGIKIITIGFGDEAGSAIYVRNPEDGSRTLVRDADGQPVVSRLNGELLREIALATDGAYVPAGTGVLDLAAIYDAHIARLTRGQLEARGRTIRGETHPIFVATALLALVAAAAITAGGRARAQAPAVRSGHRAATSLLPLLLAASVLATTTAAPARAAVVAAPSPAGKEEANAQAEVDGDSEVEASGDGADANGPAASAEAPSTPASATDSDAEPAASAPAAARADEDPRARFNRANERLAAGDAAEASVLYREARRDATDDHELRYAASYNLGVAAAAQADALENEKPMEAIALLHEAADWFREASAMQPDEEDPRHNLEVVLRRALILADELARRDRREVEAELDRLIESQRARVAETAMLLEAVARAGELAGSDALAAAFDAAATAERELLADAETVADRVADEQAILEARPQEERSPEEILRGASLEGVLAYLDQGVERMGQTRRQLRRRSAERAYRRGAEALALLKRARDQLRDPVEQLGVLMAEVAGVAQGTALLAGGAEAERRASEARADAAATEADATGAAARRPAFLTPESIAAETTAVAARVTELADRFETAAEQAAQSAGAAGASAASGAPSAEAAAAGPDAERLREALVAAAPLVGQADRAMERAGEAVAMARFAPAVEAEGEVVARLGEARELFLDLRELIEVAWETQTQLAGVASSEEAEAKALRDDALPALAALQAKNRARATRLETLLERERAQAESALAAAADAGEGSAAPTPTPPAAAMAGDPEAARAALAQRFERADALLAEAAEAMDGVRAGLARRVDAQGPDWPAVGTVASRAADRLDALRLLFLSLVEQLERLAREQVDLGDRTRETVALAAAEDGAPADATTRSEATQKRATALAAEQGGLEARAGSIADALLAQAEAAAQGSAPQAPSGSGSDADTLRRAADLVATAQLSMRDAGATLEDATRALAGAPPDQESASDSLREALALLAPPPSEPSSDSSKSDSSRDQDEQSESGEQQGDASRQQDESGSDGSAGEEGAPSQPDAAEQAGPLDESGADAAAQASEDRSAPPGARDPAQLLQGVRDREAERREANEQRARERRRSAPVEKDW